jgi:CheY-like chemotaxis protein
MHVLALHRTALATLACRLAEDRTGGVLAAAIETLRPSLKSRGVLAFAVEGDELVLIAEEGLPAAARPELARLPLGPTPSFVAQRAARELRTVVDAGTDVDPEDVLRNGLALAGWQTIAATPMAVGRNLRGVLAVGSEAPERLGRDGVLLLEAVAAMATLALDRQLATQHQRDERIAGEHAARLATMGMVSTATALDMAVPLSAMLVQLETQERALEILHGELVERLGDAAVDELESLDEAQALSAGLAEGLRRVQGVASHLLELSRRSRPAPVDLTRALDNSLALVGSKLEASGIGLTLTGDEQALLVEGRAESVQSLLVQVLLYAMQMCNESSGRNHILSIRLESEGGRHVVSIETTADNLAERRAFDAFIRKHASARAGVGLTLAAQTAVAHDGHIELDSTHHGTKISVVLPAARTRARTSRPPPPDAASSVVLAVGQEETLIEGLRSALQRHRIVAADTLAEAANVLAQLERAPEMVLCDVSLRDGGGIALHERSPDPLRKTFVFTTGGVLTSEAAEYLRASSCPTLIRPVTPDEVKLLLSDDEAPGGAPTLTNRRRRRDTDPLLSIPPNSAQRERRSVRSAQRRRAITGHESPVAKTRSKPPSGTEP